MANFQEIRYKCVKERWGKHESSFFSTLAMFDMAKKYYAQSLLLAMDKFLPSLFLSLDKKNIGKDISISNVKNTSNLKMDIFCHFKFCHSRRSTV
jgi:hypothetical protein